MVTGETALLRCLHDFRWESPPSPTTAICRCCLCDSHFVACSLHLGHVPIGAGLTEYARWDPSSVARGVKPTGWISCRLHDYILAFQDTS